MSKEMVDHPLHYNMSGRKECIVEMEELFGVQNVSVFCYLNAYKYLYRVGLKDGNSAEQDIAKAEWYLNHISELETKWHTDVFDARLKQQFEHLLKDAKKKARKIKKIEKGLGFETSATKQTEE